MAIDINKYRKTRRVSLSIPFGEHVANARNDQGVTQEQLGDRVGYSQSIVSRQETGKLEYTPRDAAAVALVLGKRSLLEHYCNNCPASLAYRRMTYSKPQPA